MEENARLCAVFDVPDRTLTLVIGRGLIGVKTLEEWQRLFSTLLQQALTDPRVARPFSPDSDINVVSPVRIVLKCDP